MGIRHIASSAAHSCGVVSSRARKPVARRPPAEQLPPAAAETEAPGERLHGNSYSDVGAREDNLSVTTSTHVPRSDRRLEEPSEPALGARERLEGET